MPIYEYEAANPERSCPRCRTPFEVLQGLRDAPLSVCPDCGAKVNRIMSWCRAAVMEGSEEDARIHQSLRDYESAGMWSHAAELADKHSEKTGDASLKGRALDDYKKAGYNVDALTKGGAD
jgi:putative FmdB family regulatory protein